MEYYYYQSGKYCESCLDKVFIKRQNRVTVLIFITTKEMQSVIE